MCSYVAPVSWLLRNDVEQGRDELNFSTWDRRCGEADDAAETILHGSMPPRRYVIMDPDARLSAEQKRALVDGLGTIDDDDGDNGGDNGGGGTGSV